LVGKMLLFNSNILPSRISYRLLMVSYYGFPVVSYTISYRFLMMPYRISYALLMFSHTPSALPSLTSPTAHLLLLLLLSSLLIFVLFFCAVGKAGAEVKKN
jgi:hypothetical protein